jgi:hypothetical protein
VLDTLAHENEQVPKLPVNLTCKWQATEHPIINYAECLAEQQATYDRLKVIWPKLSKEITASCIGLERAHSPIYPSYGVIEGCVMSHLDKQAKEAELPNIPFRY